MRGKLEVTNGALKPINRFIGFNALDMAASPG
jgi:hypothetical protein